MGVLPQDAALPERSTCVNFLSYMGRLQGLSAAETRRAVAQALEEVDLSERAEHTIDSLSHGMRRRLSAASALLGRPELVLLDEPTAGLDPAQARALREQLVRRRGERTLVISSHNLDELERICDYLVFIRKGRCVREGSLSELTAQAHEARWVLGAGPPPLEALHAALPGFVFRWHPQGPGGVLIERAPGAADADQAARVVMGLLVEHGLPLRELRRGRSLEESFLEGG